MTAVRSTDLQSLMDAAEAAILARSSGDGPVPKAAERVFSALRTSVGQVGQRAPARRPVCAYLPAALAEARRQPGRVGALAEAFAAIEPRLEWKVRAGAEAHGDDFLTGHANATLVGSEGLEIRSDVWVGVSLLAPQTRYPDHRHPPEEIYVVLSPGEWRQESKPWHAPGIGGLVYNPPNIVHAMRSMEEPLLAVWFLPT
ncbi:MAG TPA: dimethylsulfonioproprionate lyase family protein [Acetobacteraceae bacterium]|nr:dimethylsulfonioproprionate lyase family protein [Acetobacteraceae bacterium]